MQNQEQIVKRLTQLIALFWILMKAMSYKLWLTERDYPLVPVAQLPGWLHLSLLVLFFVIAVIIIFKPASKYLMIVLIITESISLLGDQTRLQPWQYQFMFSFFIIAFNNNNAQKIIQALALILVSTYFFSGIQKMQPGFIHSVWSVHILRGFMGIHGEIINHRLVQLAGYSIPLIETAAALALLFKPTLRYAAWLFIGMHIFILIFLGPLGINYNSVVWPWNLLLIIQVWLLFLQQKTIIRPAVFKSTANYIIAFFWILMPVAGCFGYWDKFLSSGLYSGRNKVKQFHFAGMQHIPPQLRKYAKINHTDSTAQIIITDWCVKELNVAAVTEPRVLNNIVKQLNERYAGEGYWFEVSELNY